MARNNTQGFRSTTASTQEFNEGDATFNLSIIYFSWGFFGTEVPSFFWHHRCPMHFQRVRVLPFFFSFVMTWLGSRFRGVCGCIVKDKRERVFIECGNAITTFLGHRYGYFAVLQYSNALAIINR